VRRAAFCKVKIFRVVENKKKTRRQKKFLICKYIYNKALTK